MSLAKKKTPLFRRILLTTLAVLLVGAVLFAYMRLTGTESSDVANSDGTPKAAPATLSEENAAAKQKFIEESEKADASKKTTSNPSENATPVMFDLDLNQEGSSVIAQAKIYNVTAGTCTVTAKNTATGAATSKTAAVMYQPQYSTCAGFSIPVSKLGAGMWEVTLDITYGNSNGTKTKTMEVS